MILYETGCAIRSRRTQSGLYRNVVGENGQVDCCMNQKYDVITNIIFDNSGKG